MAKGNASPIEIVKFLREFKKAINSERWRIVPRRAEYARMTEMNASAIKIILLQLTPNEYYDGPSLDWDNNGEYLWIFHRPDGEKPYIYIKLKLKDGFATVISFHRTKSGGDNNGNSNS